MTTTTEMLRELARLSGHHELVVDYLGGDYTDNGYGGLTYLKNGQRWLDRKLSNVRIQQRHIANIAAGQFAVEVPDLRYVDWIDLYNSTTGSRTRLNKRTLRWMRDAYDEPYENLDTGQPVDWARNTHRSRNLLLDVAADPTFSAAPTETGLDLTITAGVAAMVAAPRTWFVSKSASWTYADGVLTYIPDGLTSAIVLAQYIGRTLSGDVTIDIEATTEIDSLSVAVGYWDGAAFDAIDSSSALIVENGRVSWTPSIEWNCVYIMASTAGSFTTPIGLLNFLPSANGRGTISSVRVGATAYDDVADVRSSHNAQILLLPPSDASYTVNIFGGYYAKELEDPTDESWWSFNHPDVLIEAALLEMESVVNRNSTGVRDRMLTLDEKIRQIRYDLLEEELSGDVESTRMGYE